MPKGRMLNKKISFDEKVSELSLKSALIFTFCIPNLDVEGKILADLHYLKGNIVPYRKDFSLKDIEKCIYELAKSGLVILYGNGHKYMQFKGFEKNQTIHKEREAPSEIPDPTHEELMSNSGLSPVEVKLSKDKLREGANAPPTPEQFLETLKANPVYKHIDFDFEFGKMDVWLTQHPGRKKTQRFIINWFNKIDRPVETALNTKYKLADKNCQLCKGTGFVYNESKSGNVFCECRKKDNSQ